ncbi:MAG: acyltransferase family protein, partial [Methanobrevibacter sp.]|nr:acyltransferase family protein [Candidatus Methanoflexus mossambicus]
MIKNIKNKRIAKYDNIKGLAIILIVLFHVSLPFSGHNIPAGILNMLMALGIPLFFFVSGYFSKVDENNTINAFKRIFIPYIFFCTLWIIFNFLVLGGGITDIPYFVPSRVLWYLLALFIMRLFLPIFVKIKHIWWIIFIIAILISLIDIPKGFLALHRTLYYLPIFMLGYYFRNSDIYLNTVNSKFKSLILKFKNIINNNKIIILIIFILFIILMIFVFNNYSESFFTFNQSYKSLKISSTLGILMKLVSIIFSIIGVLIIVSLMTNKKTFLTKLGANSLAIYVLHPYFYWTLHKLFLTTS